LGRGVACSNTATLTKIREDIEEAQKHFSDLKVLFFATPRPVSEKKAKGWREKVKKDYGIILIVISREEVISELLKPENASLCSSVLRIPTMIGVSLEQTASDCRAAMAEINAWWVPRIPGAPLIDLSADELGSRGDQTDSILELKDLQEMLVQSRRVMLEAPAGRGKTTTLTQIAERCADAGNLAFIVDLPSWTQTRQDILEFIAGMRPFKARSCDATKLAKIYEAQHFIFLLNGWNEIAEADSQRAQTALGTLERQYPKAGILVSTRTHRVKPPLPGTTVRAKLRVLSPKQRADYVVARLGERATEVLRRIHTEPVLDDLTLTPLFLSEVVSIAVAGKEIPNTKMGVLREVVHLPDADPTHHGALEIAPLSGQADVYLTTLASAMTTISQTQILEPEAKQTTNEKLRQMREQGEADETATVLQVLGALVDHHLLERIEYPAVAYRFEHQQMQEYYAAEFVKQELFGLVAGANQSESLDVLAATAEAKSFQVKYVNQSSWSEPLSMVVSDLDGDSSTSEPDHQLIKAKAALVLLALDVDLIFAAELFGLSSAKVQSLVAEKLSAAIRQRWASPEKSVRSQALAAMIATGSYVFKDEILPLLKGAGEHSRFEVYRSTSTFRLSSLGPDWTSEVSAWDEKARLAFVSEMFHIAGPVREMAVFALGDPSVEVRARAFSDLMWMNTDDETTRLLMEVDEPAFEAAIERVPIRYTHPIFRARALQVYRRILAESSDPAKRLMAAGNAVLMGQSDAHAALRVCLDECSIDRVRQMDQRELRPLLEALTSDRVWRSDWIVRRVLEGALNAEQWGALIDPIDAGLKDQLLQRLETEDLTKSRVPGVQGLLRLNADVEMARRIFARIVQLHKGIEEAISIRSESNLTRARELGELRRQLEGFLRKLPAQTMVDGILAALSPELSFVELEVLAELWDWGMDNDADLHEVLTEPAREAARKYLTEAVPRLTDENDPRGDVRAHLAVAISRVADPADISYVAALLESEIGRIRAARTARAARERSRLADGSQTRYTNRYMLAVRQLQSDSEGSFLAKLLAESEYERDVAWALVEWALERSLPATVWMDGWANRPRQLGEIWEARASSEVARFDETRRKAAVGYLRSHIDSLTSGLSAETPDPQTVWRLKDLMRPLATLGSKASTALILEVLALPLQTHGTMDGWKRIQPLEIMLFEGAVLPNDQTLAIIMPVVDELNSKWHSDNERPLFSMSFGIMPFLEDPRAGISVLAELLERTRLSFEGMSKVVSALGHSRCADAVDLLVSIASKEGIANSLGDIWVNAIAALDSPRAREILMSFIDPESPEVTGTLRTGREDVLSRRIAELAGKYPTIRSRILNLCQVNLDRAKRNLLASVIVQLGDNESLLQALYLLDDELGPELPYDLGKAVEEAFVEHRPESENSNSYTLHPRPANELRDRIIEMARSDPRRKASALALLSRIESWRREYGRPIGETRNPIFGS
jgi:Fe2+ or Zn2+ uptake regulation protein